MREVSVQLHLYGPKRFIQFGEGKTCRSTYTCMGPSGSFKSAKEGSVAATTIVEVQAVHSNRRRKEVLQQLHLCGGPKRFIQFDKGRRRRRSNYICVGPSGPSSSTKEGSVGATTLVRTQAVHSIRRRKEVSRQLHLYGSERFIQIGERTGCRSNYT